MIKNVVFDVGKVLVHFEPEMVMDHLGICEEKKKRLNNAMFHNSLWNEFDRSEVSASKILEKFIELEPECETQIREVFSRVGEMIFPTDYELEWIKGLKKRGYHLFVLSNYAEFTYEETKHKMDFLQYMDGVVFSYECKMIKPEQGIYRHLIEKYHLDPSESVFLDDRKENVDAAKKAGMSGIVFKTFDQASTELEEMLNK